MFSALLKKKKTTTLKRANPTASRTVSARPRACEYKNGRWICTLANGQRLEVSGQGLVSHLRSAVTRGTSIRGATLRYPTAGKGQCMLHFTDANGRTETVRGRCVGVIGRSPNPPQTPAPTYEAGPPARRIPPRPGSGSEPFGPSNPRDLGPRCCFDPELNLIVCAQANNPFNGREVAEIISIDEGQNTAVLRLQPIDPAAGPEYVQAPLCPDQDQPSLPPQNGLEGCCYDAVTSRIICLDQPNHPLAGMPAQLNAIDEANGIVSVTVTDASGRQHQIRLPICSVQPTPTEPEKPTQPIPRPTNECCYDAAINKLLCKDASSPLNGADVVLETLNQLPNGQTVATVYVNGDPNAGMRVPLCETPDCCLDLATSTLVCESDPSSPYNGLAVNIEQVGPQLVRVSSPELLPYGFAYVPLCSTPPAQTADCCFNQDTMTIVCPDPSNPLHGQTAGIVTEFSYPNGAAGASISWPGGAARMPLCGRIPPERCPPAYCCINVDSLTFVCPGTPEMNGQAADVVSFEDQNGYRYAVLSDGVLVPVCGADCPPPQLCPDGMWRTPAGDCAMPECPDVPDCPVCPELPPAGQCPTCPPGMLLDTSTGECVPRDCPPCPPNGSCPPCPPPQTCPPCPGGGGHPPPPGGRPDGDCCPPVVTWWEQAGHCCESCAHGKECEGGCGDDCDCGKEGAHSHAPKQIGPASWITR
jgi:hypothetical protein